MVLNYFLYYLVIIPISLLPFPFLYLLSDFFFIIIYHFVGYRKKVVLANLHNSFPEKSDKEINAVCKKFYRHFCDLIIESIKIFTISEKQVKKRMRILNPEVVNRFYDEGRSVVLVGGHVNNWELYAVAIDATLKHQSIGIYKKLKSPFWDNAMRKTRQKYGLRMVATKIVKDVFEQDKNKLTATIFGADQSPGNVKSAHWMTFLNQETAVTFGSEKYAKLYNMPMIYGEITKTKRGHYEMKYEVLTESPNEHPEGEITEMHTKQLEKAIKQAPQYWLWTHRRWKHKRKQETVDS
ncbi:MAG: lipid A biosynthesis acyltransferase [Flavobacteriales bacterium]|nr:MAG: lipid A biosynthesis acyltransferase [Flavobacteriales bacterium]